MAGPLSAGIRAGVKAGKRKLGKAVDNVVQVADDTMSPLDDFLQSIGDPANITDDQLRQFERMIPGLNAADRKRATAFIGLDPAGKFPNKRILQRAGLMDPDYGPEVPAGFYPRTPAGHFPQPQQASIMKPQRTGMMGAMSRNPGRTALGIGGALGAGGVAASMMGGPSGPKMGADGKPDYKGFFDEYSIGGETNAKLQPEQVRLGGNPVVSASGLGASKPRQSASMPPIRKNASPMLSGLTGVNGAGDMSDLQDMDFGAPDIDFTEMFKQADTQQAEEMQPQQPQGKNQFMEILKTMGPLLAALFAGKMMK